VISDKPADANKWRPSPFHPKFHQCRGAALQKRRSASRIQEAEFAWELHSQLAWYNSVGASLPTEVSGEPSLSTHICSMTIEQVAQCIVRGWEET
jgi:hypothetical protein